MSSRFIKNKEDFTCEKCGREVEGDGYTNHCPRCLWSKHVDIHPGDRKAMCQGMMKPIKAENEKGEWNVIHQCIACGYEKKNRLAKDDNFDILTQLRD